MIVAWRKSVKIKVFSCAPSAICLYEMCKCGLIEHILYKCFITIYIPAVFTVLGV